MFGRSWVRFLSETQILSLSHARVMLNNSSFTILLIITIIIFIQGAHLPRVSVKP